MLQLSIIDDVSNDTPEPSIHDTLTKLPVWVQNALSQHFPNLESDQNTIDPEVFAEQLLVLSEKALMLEKTIQKQGYVTPRDVANLESLGIPVTDLRLNLEDLSTGARVGIAVAVGVFVGLLVKLIHWLFKRKSGDKGKADARDLVVEGQKALDDQLAMVKKSNEQFLKSMHDALPASIILDEIKKGVDIEIGSIEKYPALKAGIEHAVTMLSRANKNRFLSLTNDKLKTAYGVISGKTDEDMEWIPKSIFVLVDRVGELWLLSQQKELIASGDKLYKNFDAMVDIQYKLVKAVHRAAKENKSIHLAQQDGYKALMLWYNEDLSAYYADLGAFQEKLANLGDDIRKHSFFSDSAKPSLHQITDPTTVISEAAKDIRKMYDVMKHFVSRKGNEQLKDYETQIKDLEALAEKATDPGVKDDIKGILSTLRFYVGYVSRCINFYNPILVMMGWMTIGLGPRDGKFYDMMDKFLKAAVVEVLKDLIRSKHSNGDEDEITSAAKEMFSKVLTSVKKKA